MSPVCQLLKRNIDFFEGQKWVVFNPDDEQTFSLTDALCIGLHQDFRLFTQCQSSRGNHFFGVSLTPDSIDFELDGVVIFMPKAKPLLDMLLHHGASLLKQGGSIVVVGEHAGGVKSADRIMQSVTHNIQKYDNARRCSMFVGQVTQTEKFDIARYEKIETLNVHNQSISVCSLPGVFGHKKLDPGTKLLIENLPALPIKSDAHVVYDFACGAGVIGTYLKLKYPTINIMLSDVSALAVHSSVRTLELNDTVGEVTASDGMQKLSGSVDYIVCNPPFHQGTKNDYSITQSFIQNAHKKLKSGGRLYLVANKFLPYQESLQSSFGKFDVIYSDNRFAVYGAQKRKT